MALDGFRFGRHCLLPVIGWRMVFALRFFVEGVRSVLGLRDLKDAAPTRSRLSLCVPRSFGSD
jgi:hypothetical protein